MTEQKTLKRRVRMRMAQTGESYTQARAAIVGTQAESDAAPTEVEAIVLKLNQKSARVRFVGEEGEVTFRSTDTWKLAPGHVAELKLNKRWTHRGHAYASGKVSSVRIDIPALGLEPLPLENFGTVDLAYVHEPFEDPDPYAPMWRKLSATPRPAVSFHEIAWRGRAAFESGDPEDCPVCDASDMSRMGDPEGARELLMDVLHVDLRCVDAHAHLGNLEFDGNPKAALEHYEIGVRIGALSLPTDEPNLLVQWGPIYNRPYLRCMLGYGLSLWKLDRLGEAEAVFERILTLNPADNQGVRFNLLDLRNGLTWKDVQEQEEALAVT